jgi:hypothetical protein
MCQQSFGAFTVTNSSAERLTQVSIYDNRQHHKETGFIMLQLDRPPEWHKGKRHCITVVKASLQTKV